MKRVLSLILLLALVLTALPVSAVAANTRTPIYVGNLAVDYMAEEILNRLNIADKSDEEQILTVYDWIIENGERYEWDGEYRFDAAAVQQASQGEFAQMYNRKLENGEILLRKEWEKVSGLCGTDYFTNFSLDDNFQVAAQAYDMMLKMTGSCASFTSLLTVLLGHLGYDSRQFHGEFINMDGSQVEHTWNYALIDGTWYWMDIRIDHSIGGGSHQYYMIEDTEAWAKEHIWPMEQSDWLKEREAEIYELYTETPATTPPAATPPATEFPVTPEVPEVPEVPEAPVVTDPSALICSDWARDYMQKALNADLIPNWMQTQDLSSEITREEFSTVALQLYERFAGFTVPAYGGQSPFTDTTNADVLRAYSMGFVNGIGDGLFAPNDTLTREQASAMLGRVYELATQGVIMDGAFLPQGSVEFTDDTDILDYAKRYIYFFAGQSIIVGIGDGSFSPKTNMTKEQALKISVACLEKLLFSNSAS